MTEEAKKPSRRRRRKAAPEVEPVSVESQTVEEKIEEIVSEEVVETTPEPEPIVEPEPEVVSEVKKEVPGPDLSNNKDSSDPSYGLNQVRFGRGKQLWRRRTRRRDR